MKKIFLSVFVSSIVLTGCSFAATPGLKDFTLCANIVAGNSGNIESVSITPITYYGVFPEDQWTSEDNCITMRRASLDDFYERSGSFVVKGVDNNGKSHTLEERTVGMLVGLNTKNKIDLNYDIFSIPTAKGNLIIGSVKDQFEENVNGIISLNRYFGFSLQGTMLIFPVQTMYWLGATKYDWDAKDSYRSAENLTREQAAKFFVQTARKLGLREDVNAAVTYKDSASIDPTLSEYVTLVQKMGIMMGGKGYFNPKATLSVTEAVTILMRMKYGKLDESGSVRYKPYFEKAFEVDLLDLYDHNPHMILDGKYPINRGMIAALIITLLQIEGVEIPNRYGI